MSRIFFDNGLHAQALNGGGIQIGSYFFSIEDTERLQTFIDSVPTPERAPDAVTYARTKPSTEQDQDSKS